MIKNSPSTPLSIRIAEILNRLNNGETLYLSDLVEEFGVSKRTIQRDVHNKLSFLPYEQSGQKIWLDPMHLGQFNIKHIKQLANHTNLDLITPKWDISLIRDIMQDEPTWKMMPYENEKITHIMQQNMQQLKGAIRSQKVVRFQYKTKHYNDIYPYRLLYFKGMWYLAAYDVLNKKLKTFRLCNIKLITITAEVFERDPTLVKKLKDSKTIWIGEKPTKVTIRVLNEMADQFRQRSIFPNQVIQEELACGDMIITSEVQQPREIMPIIQYWLPYVKLESPHSYQKYLFDKLSKTMQSLEDIMF